MNILVIDVGTSSIRGVIYDEKGHPVFWHPIECRVRYYENGLAEQDPEKWIKAIYKIAGEAAKFADIHGINIEGISLTSQRSSIIPVGNDRRPLRPAIMWQDRRNADIVREFEQYQDIVYRHTGARINTVFSGTKMTWFKRNEPELYRKTMKICTVADYIVSRLTGNYATDPTYGSRSLLMDLRTAQWDESLTELFEIDKQKLCEIFPSGSILGNISEEFARQTGVKSGIPLISAGGDQQCAALGQGVIRGGNVGITTGTGAFILGCGDSVPENLNPNIICGAHAVPGKYVLESSVLACASLYNWAMSTFFPETAQIEEINAAVERAPAGANGCIVLPYFQGRGTPDFNDQAAGCFANLNLGTTRDDMVRALLESIACEIAINLEVMEGYIGKIQNIYIGGGLTKFSEFNQIQADVYRTEIVYDSDFSEQTSFGAWASAAVTLGIYDSYEKAISFEREKHHMRTYRPRKQTREIYENTLKKMRETYEKLYGI